MIKIYFPGKHKDANLGALASYYFGMIGRYSKVELKNYSDDSEKQVSLKMLEKYLNEGGYNIILSEHGKLFETTEFAKKLENLIVENKSVNFFIGNAFGFEKEVLEKASLVLSLSPMVMNHELASVVLFEQLFRCLNLNAGGKYHK